MPRDLKIPKMIIMKNRVLTRRCLDAGRELARYQRLVFFTSMEREDNSSVRDTHKLELVLSHEISS